MNEVTIIFIIAIIITSLFFVVAIYMDSKEEKEITDYLKRVSKPKVLYFKVIHNERSLGYTPYKKSTIKLIKTDEYGIFFRKKIFMTDTFGDINYLTFEEIKSNLGSVKISETEQIKQQHRPTDEEFMLVEEFEKIMENKDYDYRESNGERRNVHAIG